MQFRDGLLEQEVIYEQFDNVIPEPPPSQPVSDPGGAITGLTSSTLVVGGKIGTLQNVEAPQPLGPGATPKFNALSPVDVAGTNQPGLALELSGGKGTGNAVPGQVAVRYPLTGASGTALQSLSTNSYPPVASLYTNANTPSAVNNTAAETSVFTGVTPSAGSTAVVEGGITRVGTKYIVRVVGLISNTGTPTIQMKVKIGGTTVADTTAMTMPTVTNSRFWITAELQVTAIGASGSVATFSKFEWSRIVNGLAAFDTGVAGSASTIDLTPNQPLDVTLQWSAASPSNSWQIFEISISRER
jgi:hypothetical protein